MPEKRMFTRKITESDAFLEMPLSAQCLYFHLNMYADDDGFINSPKRICHMVSASEDDLKLLIVKHFVIVFESGVIVIKHWRMHNTLQNDRYHPTDYSEEFSQLQLKDNKSYTLINEMETECFQNVSKLETEHNITKHNITKPNLTKQSSRFTPPSIDEVQAYCEERENGIDAEAFIDFYESKGWMVGNNKMKDWHAAIRTWEKRNKTKQSSNIFFEVANEL